MPRRTQAEIKASLEALEIHVDSSDRVKSFAKEKTMRDEDVGGTEASQGEIVSRLLTTINNAPETITLLELQDVVSWVRANNIPNVQPFQARFAVLETHPNSPQENKDYLEQILERDKRIGIDDDEANDRFNTLLDSAPASIKADKLARLTERWKGSAPPTP